MDLNLCKLTLWKKIKLGNGDISIGTKIKKNSAILSFTLLGECFELGADVTDYINNYPDLVEKLFSIEISDVNTCDQLIESILKIRATLERKGLYVLAC